MGLTLNEAAIPDGAETERSTVELKPLRDVTVMVEVPEPPWAIVKELGVARIEKSGAAMMVRLMVTL
jgi:hypothetical protein